MPADISMSWTPSGAGYQQRIYADPNQNPPTTLRAEVGPAVDNYTVVGVGQPGQEWFVKVADVDGAVEFGKAVVSAGVIEGASLTVSGINEGDVLTAGQLVSLSAAVLPNADTVYAVVYEYSSDGGTSWTAIAQDSGNPFEYDWSAVSGANVLRVRVLDSGSNTLVSETFNISVS